MDQPLYLNQVVCGQTTLGPETLLETCLQIEKRLGRIRWEHWGPRIIDIDLLSYGNLLTITAFDRFPSRTIESQLCAASFV